MAIIGNFYKLEKSLQKSSLRPAFDYFKEAMQEGTSVRNRIFSLPVGAFVRVPITEDIFALEQVFYTKNREACFIESHKQYVDFQLVLSGIEQMEYVDIDKLTINEPYDESKDLVTYSMSDATSKFLLQEGDLAIFFPDDAHIGLPKFKESELVYKTVIKMPVGLF